MMINLFGFYFLSSLLMDKIRASGRAKKMVPRPPPAPYSRHMPPDHFLRNMPASSMDDQRNQMVHMIAN
jgi:hypothetical protein